MEIRDRLLTFALATESKNSKKNPIESLAPIFAPIASDFSGQLYNAINFQNEMKNRYDIHLTNDLAFAFKDKLIELGLLIYNGHADQFKEDSYIYRSNNEHSDHETEAEIQKNLDELVNQAKKFYSKWPNKAEVNFEENQFFQGLNAVLTDNNTSLRDAVNALTGEDSHSDSGYSPELLHYYNFSSEFVFWAHENSKLLFNFIIKLESAAVVAGTLIQIRYPTSKRPKIDLSIYLDSSLIMEFLDCNGKVALENSRKLINSLKKLGVKICVFRHTIDEVKGNITGFLNADSNYGPTATALLKNEVTIQYLSEIFSKIDYFLNNEKIKIFDAKKERNFFKNEVFEKTSEQSYYASITNMYDNTKALDRDVDSILYTLALRDSHETYDIFQSKHIFLTRNVRLAKLTNKNFSSNAENEGSIGPIVTTHDMSAILWSVLGQEEKRNISESNLLLNCVRVNNHVPTLVYKMIEQLEKITENGGIKAGQFAAMINNPRYLDFFTKKFLHQGGIATPEKSEQILSEMVEKIKHENREEYNALLVKYNAESSAHNIAMKEKEKKSHLQENEIIASKQHFNQISLSLFNKYKKIRKVTNKILFFISRLIAWSLFSSLLYCFSILAKFENSSFFVSLISTAVLYIVSQIIKPLNDKILLKKFYMMTQIPHRIESKLYSMYVNVARDKIPEMYHDELILPKMRFAEENI